MKITPLKKISDDKLKQSLVDIRIKQEELSKEAMVIEEELLNRFSERYVEALQEAIINFVNP